MRVRKRSVAVDKPEVRPSGMSNVRNKLMVLTGRGNVSGRPYYSGNLRCQAQFRRDLREWVKDPVTKKMVRDSPTGRPKTGFCDDSVLHGPTTP
jgi:hypothetical protein